MKIELKGFEVSNYESNNVGFDAIDFERFDNLEEAETLAKKWNKDALENEDTEGFINIKDLSTNTILKTFRVEEDNDKLIEVEI